MDEGERSRAVKRTRNTFFSECAKKGIAEWTEKVIKCTTWWEKA